MRAMPAPDTPPAPLPLSLVECIGAFEALDDAGDPGFLGVLTAVSSLCVEIERAEAKGVPPAALRSALGRARRIHARSHFIRRLQSWPRGYPGDFESIDMLLDAPMSTQPGTVERHLERYAYDCPAAQQHRNKIEWQAQAISRVATELGEKGRILILACGGVRDVVSVLPTLEAVGCPRLVLNDADAGALAASRQRTHAISDQVQIVPGNALEVCRRRDLGRFDLVLMGGLADYLTDRQLRFLMRMIRSRLLTVNGRLLLTNIARGNPYRSWIGYLADWHLLERSADDLEELAEGGVTVQRDRTGLSLLAEVEVA